MARRRLTRRVEAYLRDLANLQPDGTLSPVPDSANAARAFAALLSEHRDYRKVKAPGARDLFGPIFLSQPGKDSAATAAIQAWETKYLRRRSGRRHRPGSGRN